MPISKEQLRASLQDARCGIWPTKSILARLWPTMYWWLRLTALGHHKPELRYRIVAVAKQTVFTCGQMFTKRAHIQIIGLACDEQDATHFVCKAVTQNAKGYQYTVFTMAELKPVHNVAYFLTELDESVLQGVQNETQTK